MEWMEASVQEGRESTPDWRWFSQAGLSCIHHSAVCYGNESLGWVGPCSVKFRHAEHQRLHPKMTVNIPILFLYPTRVSVFQHVTLRKMETVRVILKFILPTNYDPCLFYCSVMIMRQYKQMNTRKINCSYAHVFCNDQKQWNIKKKVIPNEQPFQNIMISKEKEKIRYQIFMEENIHFWCC